MRLDIHGTADAIGVQADNPGWLTLDGTNTWVVGTGDVWVVDPGPELPDHVAAVFEAVRERGALAGIALTHGHGDHADAVPLLLELSGLVPIVSGLSGARAGDHAGEMEVIALPGHSADHLGFACGDIVFTGDAIFADSSVFVAPGPGSMAGYLAGLQGLIDRTPRVLAPGHGPLVHPPAERLQEQIDHRLDRERRLIDAIASGQTSITAMLETVWDDVPEMLLPAATVTLAAHLDKLDEEERLPADVERPDIPEWVV